jgi:hypothetical protein
MAIPYSTSTPHAVSNFTLTSDAYSVNGAPFAITFITERCVVVESAWLTTSQACRSRASAEKFCELAAPYITRKIANWITVTLARMIAALDLTPPPTTPAAMPTLSPEAECEGYGNAHWNIPIAEQNSPAVTARMGKNLCEHCAAAFDKAQAAYNRLNAPTKTLTYTAYAEAA